MEKFIPYEKALQERKAKAGSCPAADLGRLKSRYQKAGKQQSLQPAESQSTSMDLREMVIKMLLQIDQTPKGKSIYLRERFRFLRKSQYISGGNLYELLR